MLSFHVGGETLSSGREDSILAGKNFRSHNIEITDAENSIEVALSLLSSNQPNIGFPYSSCVYLQIIVPQVEIGYQMWLCITTHKYGRFSLR